MHNFAGHKFWSYFLFHILLIKYKNYGLGKSRRRKKSQFSLVKNTYFYVKCHGFLLKFNEIQHKKTFFVLFCVNYYLRSYFCHFQKAEPLNAQKIWILRKKITFLAKKCLKIKTCPTSYYKKLIFIVKVHLPSWFYYHYWKFFI